MEGQFCLRWNSFQSSLSSSLHQLRTRQQFVDVTLVAEGEFIKAHRLVLSACSPFFEELLASTSCSCPVVVLNEMRAHHVRALLNFMYHGQVSLPPEQLAEFLQVAQALHVRGLADEQEQSTAAGQAARPSDSAQCTSNDKREGITARHSTASLNNCQRPGTASPEHEQQPAPPARPHSQLHTQQPAPPARQPGTQQPARPHSQLALPARPHSQPGTQLAVRRHKRTSGSMLCGQETPANSTQPSSGNNAQMELPPPPRLLDTRLSRRLSCSDLPSGAKRARSVSPSPSTMHQPGELTLHQGGISAEMCEAVLVKQEPGVDSICNISITSTRSLSTTVKSPVPQPVCEDSDVSGHNSAEIERLSNMAAFPCPFCQKSYTSWGFRRRHVKAMHCDAPTLRCKWCSRPALTSQDLWTRHVTRSHGLTANDAQQGLHVLQEAGLVLQNCKPPRIETLCLKPSPGTSRTSSTSTSHTSSTSTDTHGTST